MGGSKIRITWAIYLETDTYARMIRPLFQLAWDVKVILGRSTNMKDWVHICVCHNEQEFNFGRRWANIKPTLVLVFAIGCSFLLIDLYQLTRLQAKQRPIAPNIKNLPRSPRQYGTHTRSGRLVGTVGSKLSSNSGKLALPPNDLIGFFTSVI